ncbi:MAG: DUF1501 domain-containing protein [Burkholderiales bacterium]
MKVSASRREFMRRTTGLSVAGAAAPWALNLAAMSEAAAQSATDYKALVCVFLHGGNDFANTVIPFDAGGYAEYAAIRSTIATPQASLVGLSSLNAPNGRQYALAPQLTASPSTSALALKSLADLFNGGQLAVMLNIGTLVRPTTKAQYNAKSVALPPKLFSHNDQQSFWQSSRPEGGTVGWGGSMADLFASGNGKSTFTCMSVSGNAVFLAGNSTVQYQVSSNGAVAVNNIARSNLLNPKLYNSAAAATALKSLITGYGGANLLETEYTKVVARSVDAEETMRVALGAPLTTAFGSVDATAKAIANPLADQLRMVARTIKARSGLGAKRQVFFVSLGGFDLHDFLPQKHPLLLQQVNDAMTQFYAATVELGVQNQVTTFTASDFGRTAISNGDGSDHGWGSHHVVMGGAVKGRTLYGTPPVLANNGPDDVGQGRLLPSTSVDQLAATLATWFGVSAADLPLVVPSIGNYSQKNLGLMI